MAPNVSLKNVFVIEDSSAVVNGCKQISPETIRTDFILQNLYAYLIESCVSSIPLSAVTDKEEKLIVQLYKIADSFKEAHLERLRELCCNEDLFTKETLTSFLDQILNELFCEGITWSRILAFLVFMSELTLVCIAKNISNNIVNVMYEILCIYVRDHLLRWINDHDGWEGMLSLSKENRIPDTKSTGWVKSLFHGTVRMLGTLANIANSSAQGFP